MLSPEFSKLILELVMPGVQHADLETESRAGNDEVRQGEAAGDEHVDYVKWLISTHRDISQGVVHKPMWLTEVPPSSIAK